MDTNTEIRTVPKRVLSTLEKVKDSGMVNMFDRIGVIEASDIFNHWSSVWLTAFCGKHSNRYMYSKVLEQFSQYIKEQSK